VVAFANNHHAFAGWDIDYIWAEQCSVAVCLCVVLGFFIFILYNF